eukprot:9971321-Karenia_brevis.AAC.1
MGYGVAWGQNQTLSASVQPCQRAGMTINGVGTGPADSDEYDYPPLKNDDDDEDDGDDDDSSDDDDDDDD